MSSISPRDVRKLVDKFFSLQWCRDNLVVPLSEENSLKEIRGTIKIAIANYSYLGTIASPIKERLKQSGFKCEFVERSQEEIQEILDLASEERFLSGDSDLIDQSAEERFLSGDSTFDKDAVLQAFKETADTETENIKFAFDDEHNAKQFEEDYLFLATEMMGSKLQNAAGSLLIYSRMKNISDVHLEPNEDSYKIKLRKDGLMQRFISLPLETGLMLVACLKNMACMDIAETKNCQEGFIERKYGGNKLVYDCSTFPGEHGEKLIIFVMRKEMKVF